MGERDTRRKGRPQRGCGFLGSVGGKNSSKSTIIWDKGEILFQAPKSGSPKSCRFSSSPTMIRFILLQNRQGKTRLGKYYVPLEDSEKHKVEYEVHRLVVNRDPKFTNFVEFRTHKVIYRRYAGLFFSMCVDITDNELAYLECIHLFVEILDHFFSNVCELDLVFNFHKVYLILDEFILARELQETSKRVQMECKTCNGFRMLIILHSTPVLQVATVMLNILMYATNQQTNAKMH
ncbi:hypothetical protein GUJ93_ZPchr0009g874 [Zizania palustris]|uniref:AP-2 complex subunit sigma n=1 Tax=Zizania palustris TaxID=103762 RepID=A0A8J5V4V9_ZIZPA|nr:hypothetical protein GUJ93_ZPchr0009g874 [Zizania palustris]